MRFYLFFLFWLTIYLAPAQEGEWKGILTQEGVEYPMTVEFKREGKQLIGHTNVIIRDSVYGGKIYGRVHKDYSMNLWDHVEEDVIYPDSLPPILRRRYQLLYRRSAFGDTIEGHWQEVQTTRKAFFLQGKVELQRYKRDTKA